jgi:hypothetical protein
LIHDSDDCTANIVVGRSTTKDLQSSTVNRQP